MSKIIIHNNSSRSESECLMAASLMANKNALWCSFTNQRIDVWKDVSVDSTEYTISDWEKDRRRNNE